MTWEEVDKYLIPAVKNLYGEELATHADYLDKQLNVTWYRDLCNPEPGRIFSDSPIPEWGRQLYKQLAGPYGKAILKAYRIKKGLE